ncbi:glycosyltransferase [Paracoccus sp. YIM 132242]|uniref:Glycosyltransferase n=1 Tax=Paracoccus lichenicola TaxID=2665644 RepID=A0A6L6HLA5_9RHOB|nr:nucleotide disphospho-sugar-binding domain-containing protein [Paracoccus lichenicola]MTD98844.1 glycosyltransferase [Paracoccus lichenicola]
MRAVLITPPLPSHLRAFEALARELTRRGHEAIFLTEPGVALQGGAAQVTLPGPPARPQPRRLLAEIVAGARRTDRLCRDGLPVLRALAPDLILGDQMEPASGLLARALGVPLVSVACAVPMDPEPGIPLPFLGWPHDTTAQGLRRNAGGERVADLLMLPQSRVIRRWAQAWNLGDLRRLQDCLSPRLALSQTVLGFDYPRPVNGAHIAPLGPFRRGQAAQDFPPDIRPDGTRPFVYVSLGTLQGHRAGLLSRIAAACRQAGAQVLVSHAGCLSEDRARAIPADWVRPFVPQQAVLERADLCVTHAGLNTALECLMAGVPMLAVPLTHDQPGVAARIAQCGAGLRLQPWQRSPARIREAVARLLSGPRFRDTARSFAAQADDWPGAAGAVDRIEARVSPPTRATG